MAAIPRTWYHSSFLAGEGQGPCGVAAGANYWDKPPFLNAMIDGIMS
ncbi:MAG: hypothetical protein HOE69_08165 [Euryarchaeota archaeon]|nr:hypothetical protein [Euryarchaeota archaeon]